MLTLKRIKEKILIARIKAIGDNERIFEYITNHPRLPESVCLHFSEYLMHAPHIFLRTANWLVEQIDANRHIFKEDSKRLCHFISNEATEILNSRMLYKNKTAFQQLEVILNKIDSQIPNTPENQGKIIVLNKIKEEAKQSFGRIRTYKNNKK